MQELQLALMGGGDYLVGWGTLALITAGLAQGKERSGLGWFLLGLLLGPIATFVLVAFCPTRRGPLPPPGPAFGFGEPPRPVDAPPPPGRSRR